MLLMVILIILPMEMIKLFIQFSDMEELKVGDVVSTTTSTFDYDNVAGTFANDLNAYADVEVEYHHSDYSEYDSRTCRDGGNYGYDYYVVTKIHEVGELYENEEVE